jgi:hypothetical protein
MGLPDGLTPLEQADYLTTLAGDYEQRTRIEILTNERTLVSTIPAAVIGGQVDATRVEADLTSSEGASQEIAISRYAKGVVLYDPTHSVALDSGSPADGALYLDRSIRIIVSIRGRLRWYDNAVFTGPVTDLERTGTLITLDAEGPESFGKDAAWTTDKYDGTKIEAFRSLMYRSGEVDAWMDVPSSKEKLASVKHVARDTRVWDMAFFIMASLDRLCFYDGYGRLRTPVESRSPVIEFHGGNDGLLLGEPTVKYSTENFRNAWWEQTSSKTGKDVEALITLDDISPNHPLRPVKIGRNGRGRHLMGTESNGDLRTKAKATARGTTLLKNASSEVEVQAECRPVWHLSPYDWALMRTPQWAAPFPVREFSLPLAGGPMTLGYRDEIPSPHVARIRGK